MNEYRPAGSYEVEFATGINLQIPSGVYYYQLRAGDYKTDEENDFDKAKYSTTNHELRIRNYEL